MRRLPYDHQPAATADDDHFDVADDRGDRNNNDDDNGAGNCR
jgi:hypothetical protein